MAFCPFFDISEKKYKKNIVKPQSAVIERHFFPLFNLFLNVFLLLLNTPLKNKKKCESIEHSPQVYQN